MPNTTYGGGDSAENDQISALLGDRQHYSSADGPRFFEWEDAHRKSPRQLALMFIGRFPQLASGSIGMDYAYAGWFAALLGAVEYGRLPVFYADYELDLARLDMPPPPPKQWPPNRERPRSAR